MSAQSSAVRCVLVGPSSVGKTSLCFRLRDDWFEPRLGRPLKRDDHVPVRAWDDSEVEVTPKGKIFVQDSQGAEDYDRIRPLLYADVAAVLVCFRVDSRASLRLVQEKFIPEVKRHCGPHVRWILVGCQEDLRDPDGPWTSSQRQCSVDELISDQEICDIARKEGACCSFTCSAATGLRVRELFEAAATEALTKSSATKCSLQ